MGISCAPKRHHDPPLIVIKKYRQHDVSLNMASLWRWSYSCSPGDANRVLVINRHYIKGYFSGPSGDMLLSYVMTRMVFSACNVGSRTKDLAKYSRPVLLGIRLTNVLKPAGKWLRVFFVIRLARNKKSLQTSVKKKVPCPVWIPTSNDAC